MARQTPPWIRRRPSEDELAPDWMRVSTITDPERIETGQADEDVDETCTACEGSGLYRDRVCIGCGGTGV